MTSTVDRTMDARHLNEIANHPSVRPYLGGDGPVDLSVTVDNPEHVAFQTEHGGFVCIALGAGRYDVHSMFLPEGRGEETASAQREAVEYMFSATDCTELRTTVPDANRAALGLARMAHFERRFDGTIPWFSETRVSASFLGLSIDRWAMTSTTLPLLGAWFHDTLTRVKQAAGSLLPVHPDDAVHDRIAGAALLMVRAGNVEKGVRFFNVFAQLIQHMPITLLRSRPVVIDVGDAIVEAGATEMKVLLCRM